MRHFARHNVKLIQVTQYAHDFQPVQRKNVAFEEWRLRLKKHDRLPRGPFFKGKTPGKQTFTMVDEFWNAFTAQPHLLAM